MLSKSEMVRRAIEMMYDGKCDIIEHIKYKGDNGATYFKESVKYKNVPCRLSFSSSNVANQTDGKAEISQIIKVFMSNEYAVNAGSKIVITQNSLTKSYKSSGVPSVYETHQEIKLELFETWA